MSDIVWAINPERDHLRDLTRKMRQHADEIFTLRDIDLEFNAPVPEQDLKLGMNVRRDLLLVFKEAVNNVARHAKCSRVAIDFAIDGDQLSLRVCDNGAGFDPQLESAGHGLVSMRRRVENLGGNLNVDSNEGSGTSVSLVIPLNK
jgi:signal transduction histidine kinase